MSNYYDINKPFSLENWSNLVKDVNTILQNPPESDNPNCQPVSPLEEPTDPHIWSTNDVIVMQDKLKETCPSIYFTVGTTEWVEEYKWKWMPEIIDELTSAMNQSWCGCPSIESCGTYGFYKISGTTDPEKCCGNIVQHLRFWSGTDNVKNAETQYFGDYYPEEDPIDLTEIRLSNSQAASSMYDLERAWNITVSAGLQIRGYQNEIDTLVADIDSDIAYYNSNCKGDNPPSDCSSIQNRIQENGDEASEKQEFLDEQLLRWNGAYGETTGLEGTSDSAATQNWAAWMAVMPQYQYDINLIEECFDPKIEAEPDLKNWYRAFNPYTTSFSSVRPLIIVRLRYVVMPDWWNPGDMGCTKAWDENMDFFSEEDYECGEEGYIEFATNGYAFSSQLGSFILENTVPLSGSRSRIQCSGCTGNIISGCCYHEGGICDQTGELQIEVVTCLASTADAEECVNTCGTLLSDGEWTPWDGEEPDLTEGPMPERGIREARLKIKWGSHKGKDNTAEKERYINEFTNWYTEHPKYDNRHSTY